MFKDTTDLALVIPEGMSLSEAMGINMGGGSSSTLARVNQVQTALTETDSEGDDIIKVPVGAFKVTLPDGEVVYSKTLTTRIFSQRHQWQRWDADTKTMHKTLLAPHLNADLKDTTGKLNLGRPTGYIKDFQSLPEEMKGIIRSVKRVRVLLGVLTLDKPTDERGNAILALMPETPFVMDVKNTESIKAIDTSIQQITNKKITPIEHTLKFGSAKRDLPTGQKYAIIVPALGDQVNFGEGDSQVLQDFIDWVTTTNSWITGKHDEAATGSLSASDAEVVGSIIGGGWPIAVNPESRTLEGIVDLAVAPIA